MSGMFSGYANKGRRGGGVCRCVVATNVVPPGVQGRNPVTCVPISSDGSLYCPLASQSESPSSSCHVCSGFPHPAVPMVIPHTHTKGSSVGRRVMSEVKLNTSSSDKGIYALLVVCIFHFLLNKVLSSFMHPPVVQNLHMTLSSLENKGRYLEKCSSI